MQIARVRMNENGRVVIPAEFRKEMGIEPGDLVLLELEDRELRLTTLKDRIAQVQQEMKKYFPPGTRLSQELIAERREAAKRE
jgi:AbrB family looped-hinge helix DNA binding protein